MRKVTRGVSIGNNIQEGRDGNGYQMTQKEHVLYGEEKFYSRIWSLGQSA